MWQWPTPEPLQRMQRWRMSQVQVEFNSAFSFPSSLWCSLTTASCKRFLTWPTLRNERSASRPPAALSGSQKLQTWAPSFPTPGSSWPTRFSTRPAATPACLQGLRTFSEQRLACSRTQGLPCTATGGLERLHTASCAEALTAASGWSAAQWNGLPCASCALQKRWLVL